MACGIGFDLKLKATLCRFSCYKLEIKQSRFSADSIYRMVAKAVNMNSKINNE